MNFEILKSGSITCAQGFRASGIAAGLKRSGAPDCALLVSDVPAVAAGAFTSNRFPAAPVVYDKAVLQSTQHVRAIFINSGNANACTGNQGMADVHETARHIAQLLGINLGEVLISSTGRIGVPMPMDRLLKGAKTAVAALNKDGGIAAAQAIMTTDTRLKSTAVQLTIDGKSVHIGGMTKGAGMIAPKLRPHVPEATMLAYVTTDAAVHPDFLQACLEQSLDLSFNRITVDGDTSTNDTFIALANGVAGNQPLNAKHPQAAAFVSAFNWVVSQLAREMILDGEGVTRFVELHVGGAVNREEARRCAEAIANSLLCKTAWFGADPNWGRILAAAGYAGVELDPGVVNLDYDGVPIVRNGTDAGTPEADQAAAISKREFRIDLDLGVGDGEFTVWTCDLSYDYVKINADYHT